MNQVSVRNITRRVGDRTILKNVSLDVVEGEIIAIMGPSGSGKTSLLRIIDMLEPPDGGTISIDRRDALGDGQESLQGSMAMVFQKPVAFSMSVYDNIAYGMKIRGMGRGDISAAVNGALKLLDMEGKGRQNAKSLSGGEVQRMAFARAYVLKPRLLLLDEPTANLDPANAGIIENAIRDVNERYGTTVILVTHDMHQAKRLAGRTAVMVDGEIIELKPTRELFESPSDMRTRKFIKGDILGV